MLILTSLDWLTANLEECGGIGTLAALQSWKLQTSWIACWLSPESVITDMNSPVLTHTAMQMNSHFK